MTESPTAVILPAVKPGPGGAVVEVVVVELVELVEGEACERDV
jgi:hypothetical protein